MGTNFYYAMRIDDNEKKSLVEKMTKLFDNYIIILNKDNLTSFDVENIIEEICEESNKLKTFKIHLGKRSCGWQFLWNHNNFQYYGPDIESIKKFLSTQNGVIIDEYGETFSFDEFFNDEISYCLYRNENCMTIDDYNKKNVNLNHYNYSHQISYNGTTYTSRYGEYLINDLRFADTINFS